MIPEDRTRDELDRPLRDSKPLDFPDVSPNAQRKFVTFVGDEACASHWNR